MTLSDNEIAVRAENLGKMYYLRHRSLTSLSETLSNALSWPVRKLFPFEEASSNQLERNQPFWALRHATFEVRKGEVLGIIGRNGTGKSTLLKLLSRITQPTEGHAQIRGRQGILLEVGSGFHPELTGRENVFLNGAILGMKRAEIASKFDAIVDFAGVPKFIDTPVKFYSSGMYVRLAFSVAAHLDAEILIVDEVLAVGDLGFIDKSVKKIESLADEGRTILIVSHIVSLMLPFCDRLMLIEDGQIDMLGDPQEVADEYNRRLFGESGATPPNLGL
jgi:lipopolysaccharide transport system ATP-binding protein